ncbi:recombinase family protein [Bradyrhizobium sp. CCGB20]|uniref:recombinase family protein n=1 Tax=Bradyrhizobium sp. CCGB20 TaxID=2949633 RepID=UPI0020B3751B|nr:recombinase family protein [Bradyrhizobium sp. CCGB20]MCP3400203.1 recombinase family protein [Bradyrhizobium sp. CCGB20]
MNTVSNGAALIRAVQYLRMSSENQRYSTENQQNAIAEYATRNGFHIVESYIDAAKSGLSLKGRKALQRLLSDTLAPQRDFDAILVLDVSRWGRFQNPDQAGYYEFLCRQAGVMVVYCGEPFGEEIVPINTIVKHLKRVMAGEFSRELSEKMSRAHLQQARLGFRQGGCLLYGFRRLLVDENRKPRQILNRGERKAISNDKVLVVPGPPEELAVIRRIFRLYVRDELSADRIAERLAKEGVKGYGDKPLSGPTVLEILHSGLCIGQMTYNVTTKKMQASSRRNPERLWTRFRAFDPIVPPALFSKAQERLARFRRRWTTDEVRAGLERLLMKKGRLSQAIINEDKNIPSASFIAERFGSLRDAYAAIGYAPPNALPFGMNGKCWSSKEILIGLQKLHQSKGYVSHHLIDKCLDLPASYSIRKRFGSMRNAMERAGLPVLSRSEVSRRIWQRRRAAGTDQCFLGVQWTDTALLRALRQLEKKHGYVSHKLVDQNGETPSTYYYTKRFGSLTKARELAGLPKRTPSEILQAALKRKREGKMLTQRRRFPEQRAHLRYRTDDLLFGLKKLARRKGRISAFLIDEDPGLPSALTLIRYFGSLHKAYQLAGLVRLDDKYPVRFGWPPGK